MEALELLEDKVSSLIDIARLLKEENAQLVSKNDLLIHENKKLTDRLSVAEETLKNDEKQSFQEKKLTTTVVDRLIESIDRLVKSENYSNG